MAHQTPTRVLVVGIVASLSLCIGCARSLPAERRLIIAFPTGLHSADVNDPAHEAYAYMILGNVYETLVEVQPDLTLRPALAESWRSPDDLTWVFRLRSDVRFHDGRLLTAADVVASFERARQNPWLRGEMDAVIQVHAQGPREVVFTTRTQLDGLPQRLTYFFVTGTPRAAGAPAPGTGPYRIRSWHANGPTILDAVTDYRDGRAPIPVVEFQTVPDPRERVLRLQRGQAHLTTDVMPEEIASPSKIKAVAAPGVRVVFLAMDCARERSPSVRPQGNPFRDRRVREGVALAIDRGALVAGPLRGYADPVDQLPTVAEMGFDPQLARRAHDLSRATRLLAEVTPAGFDVELSYMGGKYLAGDAMVENLAAQLERAGIRATTRAYGPAEFLKRMESHELSLYVLGWSNDTGSAHNTYNSLLHSTGGGLGAINGGNYSNPELDKLLDVVPSEQHRAVRGELLRRATRIVDQDLPIIPLYRQKSVYAFTSELEFEPQLYPRIRVAAVRWRE